ncbi:MAG: DUF4276 family protein [Deltaproteobacteria bacterium]|nr:DUF4276 family protein [Deltaproteobacteria bacterium]
MRRVLLLVEGQTEEAFVRRVLQPHLWPLAVDAQATMVFTSRAQGRRAHRGGVTTYERIRKDVDLLLHSRPDAVTTLFDVYAFPKDMPGYPYPWPAGTEARVAGLTAAFEADVNDRRFFAGFIAHEFEGLLFTAPAALAEAVETDTQARTRLAAALAEVRRAFPSPEDIDDGAETAPSKRLLALCAWNKVLHGPEVAGAIGLAAIRQACPLFSAWLARLENV